MVQFSGIFFGRITGCGRLIVAIVLRIHANTYDRAGCAMVEHGVERMATSPTWDRTAAVGAVENNRNTRKGTLPTLCCDERQIIRNAAAISTLLCARPSPMLICELENVCSQIAENIGDSQTNASDHLSPIFIWQALGSTFQRLAEFDQGGLVKTLQGIWF